MEHLKTNKLPLHLKVMAAHKRAQGVSEAEIFKLVKQKEEKLGTKLVVRVILSSIPAVVEDHTSISTTLVSWVRSFLTLLAQSCV